MGRCLLNTKQKNYCLRQLAQQHSAHINNLSIILNNIQQEQIAFQQQIVLKFKEETNEMIQLQQSFL